MALSDDARKAMTLHMGCGRGWTDTVLDRLVADALAAVLPDGRTIAQALDALAAIEAACSALPSFNNPLVRANSPAGRLRDTVREHSATSRIP